MAKLPRNPGGCLVVLTGYLALICLIGLYLRSLTQ